MNLRGNRTKDSLYSGGFALPTILIASVVMLTVLLVAVTSTATVRVSLMSQNYNQIAKNAGEAGLAYAKACLDANNGIPQWSDTNPLKPGTDCTGTQLTGFTCPVGSTDSRCSVMTNDTDGDSTIDVRSTFTVGYPQTKIDGWKQVVAGAKHNCGIASDGQVYCWGYNLYGQLGNNSVVQSKTPVAIVTAGTEMAGLTAKSISAGDSDTCVVASDGNAYCWGLNDRGQLGNSDTGVNSSVPVLVHDGAIPSGLTIISISVGRFHTCAIASDNNAYCWGRGTNGQLGNTASLDSPVPVQVTNTGALLNKTIKSISSSEARTCAIASDNNAYCWGWDGYGGLGNDAAIANSNVPVQVETTGVLSGKTIISISSGTYFACAIASDSQAYCWGRNDYGQLGNVIATQSPVPVQVTTTSTPMVGQTFLSVAAGNNFTCAIASDNQVYCWGYGVNGQLGNGLNVTNNSPVRVSNSGVLSGKTILSITTTTVAAHVCAVASDGQAYCWGSGGNGQLGNNLTASSNVPVTVITDNVMGSRATEAVAIGAANLLRSDGGTWRKYEQTVRFTRSELLWKQISIGHAHTCGIAYDGNAYCWGFNGYGQFGNNSTASSSVPVAVDTTGVLKGKTIKSISTGYYHTCAIASDSKVYCWGYNLYGQVGNGLTTDSLVPVLVSGGAIPAGSTFTSISAGIFHNCAVASNNQAYCWGHDDVGQLGDGATDNTGTLPVAVNTTGLLSGKTILSVSSGGYHTCVITSDNQAYCWGDNVDGQLGNNTVNPSNVPVLVSNGAIPAGKTFSSIVTGYTYTCAIATNNLGYCWGHNGKGELGNNSINDSLVPVAIDTTIALNGKTLVDIAAGSRSLTACAVASDSKAYCWGLNDYGQVGNGSIVDSLVPVSVNAVSGVSVLYGKTIEAVETGDYHSCAIDLSSHVYCWGRNNVGELGNGFIVDSRTPVAAFPASYNDLSF